MTVKRDQSVSTNEAAASAAKSDGKESAGEAHGANAVAGSGEVASHAAADEGTALASDERLKRGERIIQDHVLMGLVAGLIPGPAVDLAAGFGVQLAMLARLAKLHGVPFRHDLAKNIITSLFGSLGGVGAGTIVAASLIKVVPVFGTLLGFVGTSASMGAFTYAVGKLFQRHFEAGGTFDDMKPSAYRAYFKEMFQRGKTIAAEKADEANAQAKAADQAGKQPGTAAGV